jgi:hypothetical protein
LILAYESRRLLRRAYVGELRFSCQSVRRFSADRPLSILYGCSPASQWHLYALLLDSPRFLSRISCAQSLDQQIEPNRVIVNLFLSATLRAALAWRGVEKSLSLSERRPFWRRTAQLYPRHIAPGSTAPATHDSMLRRYWMISNSASLHHHKRRSIPRELRLRLLDLSRRKPLRPRLPLPAPTHRVLLASARCIYPHTSQASSCADALL